LAQSSLGPAAIYKLETFGGLALAGGGARSLSHQRLRLALLALLAAAGERGLSRDQILGYLWPESEGGAARHSLEQLLHALRRAFGDSVFIGVNPVALNTEVVNSDVAEFEQALRREDFADAVGLYRGPFLNGFYLNGAKGFERWVETERARLAGLHLHALLHLAERSEQVRDVAATVEWRKRIAAIDPLSSRYALQYMQGLVVAGDRGAALAHARVHEELVKQELETEPDPSIGAYVSSLRAGTATPAAVSAKRDVTPVAATKLENSSGVNERAASGGTTSSLQNDVGRPRTRRRVVGVIAAALALIAISSWTATLRTPEPTRDQRLLVVVPFRINSPDSSTSYLREGLVDLISTLLTGDGGLRAVDPRTVISAWKRVTMGREGNADDARRVARELGAGQALLGSVVATPTELTISANVLDPGRGERQPPVRVTGSRDSLQSVIAAFVRQLLSRRSGIPERTLAVLTTVSTPALRAYIDGRAAHRRSDNVDAVAHFARALEIDSTFALAALDLAVATHKVLRHGYCSATACGFLTITGIANTTPPLEDAHFETAIRLASQARDKLGIHDQQFLDALRGRHYPRPSRPRELIEDLQKAANLAPDRVEIQYLLGVVTLFQGAALEYSDALRRAEAFLDKALRLDPTYDAPLARLVDVAAYEEDPTKLRRYGALYLARDSSGATADFVRWRVAAGTGDAAALRAIRARFDSLDILTLKQIMFASQTSALALDDADRASRLVIARTADSREHEGALYEGHMLALNRGRPQLADSLLRERRKGDAMGMSFWSSATLAAVFGQGSRGTGKEVASLRSAWLATNPLMAPPRSTGAPGAFAAARAMGQQALWDYDRGDTAAARAGVRWLDEHNAVWMGDVVRMLLATDESSGDAPALRARIDSMVHDGCCGDAPVQTELVLARAFERAGEDTSALRVLRHTADAFFLATSLKKQGEIALRLKDYASARRALERYLILRSDPEPSLRAERDSIRHVVEGLPHFR
jgi:DNA-binding SARP family transcriptional activator/TolB-like protein